MNPPMYRRVRDWLVDSGLTTGFTVQTLVWTDSRNLAEAFLVFRPNNGTAIQNDLGADHYVLIDVIGAKGKNGQAEDVTSAIINFIQSNPMPNDCIGHIQNVGGFPSPVLTTEGRMVFRIQFSVTYGE